MIIANITSKERNTTETKELTNEELFMWFPELERFMQHFTVVSMTFQVQKQGSTLTVSIQRNR